jgi:hypothetical protein
MTTLAVLNAERIKLSTTRSPVWCAAAVGLLSLGLAGLQAATAYDFSPLPPQKAALGVVVFGVPVLMVLASMTVTGEYRTGLIRTTFMATPNRGVVLLAKAVVSAVFSALCAGTMTIAAVMVARLVAKPLVGSQLSLTETTVWQTAVAIGLYAALAAVLGVGVGVLLRFSAGAVAVLLLWPLLAEPLLGNLPSLGSEVGPYLPFGNAFRFVGVTWLYPSYDMPWGRLESLIYFVVAVVAVFLAASVTVNRRDA